MGSNLIIPIQSAKKMSVLKRNFCFTHNLSRTIPRNFRLVKEYLPLTISGVAYFDKSVSVLSEDNRYKVDIESVTYEGKDITHLVEFIELDEEIEGAALNHATTLFQADPADFIDYEMIDVNSICSL